MKSYWKISSVLLHNTQYNSAQCSSHAHTKLSLCVDIFKCLMPLLLHKRTQRSVNIFGIYQHVIRQPINTFNQTNNFQWHISLCCSIKFTLFIYIYAIRYNLNLFTIIYTQHDVWSLLKPFIHEFTFMVPLHTRHTQHII